MLLLLLLACSLLMRRWCVTVQAVSRLLMMLTPSSCIDNCRRSGEELCLENLFVQQVSVTVGRIVVSGLVALHHLMVERSLV